jgi:hypothetical protein
LDLIPLLFSPVKLSRRARLFQVYNNAGTANVRNADASSASAGKKANGFVLAAVLSGANATVYFGGLNTARTGMTPGPLFLSGVTPGGVVSAAPITSGQVVQGVGFAITTAIMQFVPGGGIVLA